MILSALSILFGAAVMWLWDRHAMREMHEQLMRERAVKTVRRMVEAKERN